MKKVKSILIQNIPPYAPTQQDTRNVSLVGLVNTATSYKNSTIRLKLNKSMSTKYRCMPINKQIYTTISINLSVEVSKLQVAILARSSREMSQTVRIV